MTDFICKFINEPVLDYFSEVSLKVLLYLFHIKVHKINFSGFYKGFYISENDVFIILLLIISIVIKSVFAFIIWIKVFNIRN